MATAMWRISKSLALDSAPDHRICDKIVPQKNDRALQCYPILRIIPEIEVYLNVSCSEKPKHNIEHTMERPMHIKTYIAAPIPPKYVAPRVEAMLGKRSDDTFDICSPSVRQLVQSIRGTVEAIGREKD
jgi:hypothetical protein